MKAKKAAKTKVFPVPEAAFQQKPQTLADHVPNRSRRLFVPANSPSLPDRSLAALWPWGVREYPGKGRLRAWLMGGCSVETAETFRRKFPKTRAAMVADRLELKIAEMRALVIELRTYAARPDKPGRFVSRKAQASRVAVAPPSEG